MSPVCISRIATATPPHDVHAAFVAYACSVMQDRHARSLLKVMGRRSGIEHRYSFIQAEGELAPNSLFRREAPAGGDVKRMTARYMQADSEVSAEQLRQIVEKTRKLMGGLLGGIPSGGIAFLERFLGEFSPENIAAQAKSDKTLGGWTEDAKNWNKYEKMFEDQQAQVFRERMFEAIAKKAEALMTGTHRKET